MKYLQERLKLRIYSIVLIYALLLTALTSNTFSLFSSHQEIPNNMVSTGTFGFKIEPKHIKYFTEEDETKSQDVLFINTGGIPLQYKATKINKSHDCQYVKAYISINGATPYISEGLDMLDLVPTNSMLIDTDTISYKFALKEDSPERNVNCEINLHIVGWQYNIPNPTSGFTTKEILKIGILFKKTPLATSLGESEVKSFPTSDDDILSYTLL